MESLIASVNLQAAEPIFFEAAHVEKLSSPSMILMSENSDASGTSSVLTSLDKLSEDISTPSIDYGAQGNSPDFPTLVDQIRNACDEPIEDVSTRSCNPEIKEEIRKKIALEKK